MTGSVAPSANTLAHTAATSQKLLTEVERAIVGKREVLELILTGLLADGYLLDRLAEMRQSALSLVQEQQSLNSLFALLPVGVTVSTLWGELQFTNDSMRRFLAGVGIDEPARLSLPALVAQLTETPREAVLGVVRSLIAGRSFVRLEGAVRDSPAVRRRSRRRARRSNRAG